MTGGVNEYEWRALVAAISTAAEQGANRSQPFLRGDRHGESFSSGSCSVWPSWEMMAGAGFSSSINA